MRPASLEPTARGLGQRTVCSPVMGPFPVWAWPVSPGPPFGRGEDGGSEGSCPRLNFMFAVQPLLPLVKNPSASAGDVGEAGLITWSGRCPDQEDPSSSWRRAWDPLQSSCLENPMDRGAWRATVHGITNSQTRLSGLAPSSTLLLRSRQVPECFPVR